MAIKQSPEGWWIIEGDTHVSQWVIQNKRLDCDQNSLPILYRYIRPGDVVLDVGANIGDHTLAYSDWTSTRGKVMAVECGSEALQCLRLNMASRPNVYVNDCALWSEDGWLNFNENRENVGASYVSLKQSLVPSDNPVRCYALDSWTIPRLDFVKVDAEGAEVQILRGARQTILRHHPILCLEVNKQALERLGTSESELLSILKGLGYTWDVMHDVNPFTSDQYDIIAGYQGVRN